MAFVEYQTQMKDLLTDLKATFMGYSRSLTVAQQKRPLARVDRVSGWVRGVLTPKTRLPVVTVLPDSERIVKRQTGNQIHVERTVAVEVYDKGLDADKVKRSVLELVEDVREAIQTNPWIKTDIKRDPTQRKTVYSYGFDAIQAPEGQPWQNNIVTRARFLARFVSRETLPARTIVNTYVATETDDLSDRIVEAIRTASGAWTDQSFKDIQVLDSMDEAVYLNLPAVGIFPRSEDGNHLASAGREQQTRGYEIWVLSKMLGGEKALDQSLDLTEAVKKVLQVQFRFQGRATNSEIGVVGYYTEPEKRIYGSVIPLTTQSFETTPRGV